ncbi:hypothetical protein ACKWTF_001568 [Chironomus riparius]
MNLKVLVCVFGFIFVSNLSFVCGQNEALSCNYSNSSSGYSCGLKIINPNGFNNFTGINGTHLTGMTDIDVLHVYKSLSNTLNIPSIICETFQNTQTIELTASGIQLIDEDSFQKCTKLQYLDLKNNKIRQFHKNAFKENSELAYLLLWYNQITELPEDPFSNLQKLVRLDFELNNITILPENIFNPLTGLSVLYLEKNSIEVLPRNIFSSLQNMSTLVMHNNKLKILHSDSFGHLPKLEAVNMNSNQIDAIDGRLINNTGVISFELRSNLCVSKDIFDNSDSRESMRADLKLCFENYDRIMSGCADGNIDERVCKLEGKHEEVIKDIKALTEENEQMRLEINNLAKEKQELEENILTQNKIFTAAITELEHQMFELKGCGCGCQ